MFKHYFILGLVAGLFGTLISYAYTSVYGANIIDFSEKASVINLLAHNFMFTMGSCFVAFGISKIIKKPSISEFIFNFLLSGVSIVMVFVLLKQPDPVFKEGSDAASMAEYFKSFFMPILFIPAMSWFAFKPLIIKN